MILAKRTRRTPSNHSKTCTKCWKTQECDHRWNPKKRHFARSIINPAGCFTMSALHGLHFKQQWSVMWVIQYYIPLFEAIIEDDTATAHLNLQKRAINTMTGWWTQLMLVSVLSLHRISTIINLLRVSLQLAHISHLRVKKRCSEKKYDPWDLHLKDFSDEVLSAPQPIPVARQSEMPGFGATMFQHFDQWCQQADHVGPPIQSWACAMYLPWNSFT